MKYLMIILCSLGLLACTDNGKPLVDSEQQVSLSDALKTKASEDENYAKGLQEGSMIGLDVRTPEEIQAHDTPKALHIPLQELDAKADTLDKSKTILVFCESGNRAGKAKALLESRGFENVVNITDWRHWNKIHHQE